jgi:hypothetical protein
LDGFVSQLTHSLLTFLGVTTSTISEQRGFFFLNGKMETKQQNQTQNTEIKKEKSEAI